MAKIAGLNDKEQRLFNSLAGGKEKSIRDLKRVFQDDAKAFVKENYQKGTWDESDVDAQAQSFVRNSIRRLIRDGWVEGPAQNEKLARGTYRLSKQGEAKVEKGVTETLSFTTRQERKAATLKRREEKKAQAKAERAKLKAKGKKAAPKKAVKAKAKAAPKKVAKKAAPVKKVAKAKAAPKKAAPVKKVDAKAEATKKVEEAKKKAAQAQAQEKAREAASRASAAAQAE